MFISSSHIALQVSLIYRPTYLSHAKIFRYCKLRISSDHVSQYNAGSFAAGNMLSHLCFLFLNILCNPPRLPYSGWAFLGQKAPLTKICHTYPIMVKLGTVIPYLKKIQKINQSRDTPPEICWHKPFFKGN